MASLIKTSNIRYSLTAFHGRIEHASGVHLLFQVVTCSQSSAKCQQALFEVTENQLTTKINSAKISNLNLQKFLQKFLAMCHSCKRIFDITIHVWYVYKIVPYAYCTHTPYVYGTEHPYMISKFKSLITICNASD